MAFAHRNSVVLVPEDPAGRQRRQRRLRIVAGILVMAIAVALSVRPAARSLRRWHARRLAAEAIKFMAAEQWQKGFEDFQQAQRLGPNEPAVLKAKAHLLTVSRNFAMAADTWKRLAEAGETLSLDERRDYATALLESNDVAGAKDQITKLQSNGSSSPADWIVQARLAERSGDRDAVGPTTLRVIASPVASERQRYEASILLLADSADVSTRRAAWECLDKIGNSKTTVGLAALNFLAAQHGAARLPGSGNEAPPIDPEGLANRLEANPAAGTADRLRAVDLRMALRPSEREALIAGAIERFKNGDDPSLTALCFWLLNQKKAEAVLPLVPIERASHTKELSAARMESLSILERWPEMENEIQDSSLNLKLDDLSSDLYLAVAAGKQGKRAAYQNRWDRAFELAVGDSTKLLQVGRTAEHDELPDKAEAGYRASIAADPRNRAAHDALLALVVHQRGSVEAYSVLVVMAKRWPNDPDVQNMEAYAGLIGGKISPEAARDRAEQLVKQYPADSTYRGTLALAFLRMRDPKRAWEAFGDLSDLKAHRVRVSTAAIHAAVLGANGMTAQAQAEAKRIPPSMLLPEERAMVEPLLQ